MAKSVPVSVRLDHETFKAARELARRTSRPLSRVVSELAEEALRMRRYPGIVFAGPPGDRRARIEGTGLEVWEVIAMHRSCGENPEQTLKRLEHISARQLEVSLRYAGAHRSEIDALISENERSQEEWERLYPHLASTQS